MNLKTDFLRYIAGTLIFCLFFCTYGCKKEKRSLQKPPAETSKQKVLQIFPGLPEFPGSSLAKENKNEKTAEYTVSAEPETVRKFYIKELEKRNPPRKDEPYQNAKRRKCGRRWNLFDKPEGLYVIKGRRALLIKPDKDKIVYERREAGPLWAQFAELTDKEYILIVRRFANYMNLFKGAPAERNTYIEKGGIKLGVSIERLQELTPVKLSSLIGFMQKQPELCEKEGIASFLNELEFWKAVDAATAPDCPSPLDISGEELTGFKQKWKR